MRYLVTRLPAAPPVDAMWNRQPWKNVPALTLGYYMGDKPEHAPRVEARLGYDADALYAIFRVEDRYVRAVARQDQDPVCRDSCVEFFFVPGTDIAGGYFNLEINCGGIMLFHFQKKPRKDAAPIAAADLAEVARAHSLPARVEPELKENVAWTVAYRMPFGFLSRYRAAERPGPGTVWRANFYKCADETSHPHWLTWTPVRRPQPDFHVPEDFGMLEFA